jgi:hypothetical protein
MGSNVKAIERIRDSAPSDAEALAQMFESSALSDDGTPAGRLRAILEATESSIVPGLQTGIKFHDSGFRTEFTDPWPSSDNQVGHFLTAVGLSFNPAKVAQSFMGRRLRDWLGADASMSDSEVAMRLTVGHEKSPDPGAGTAAGGGFLGGILGGAVGAGIGAAAAVLGAFRDQFAAATDSDIQVFTAAEKALGSSTPLDLAAANSKLRGGITVDPTGRGNSYQDLLLSLYGWRLGQWIKAGKFKTGAEIAAWVRANLM